MTTIKDYMAQVTFYSGDEPVAVQVTNVLAESIEEAEVAAYEVAEDMVDLGTWDYGHDQVIVEILTTE